MIADYSPGRWFEQHFLSMLTTRFGRIDRDVEGIITELITASVMQHSCLDLAGKSPELIERLGQQSFVGAADDHQPLIVTDTRLYLNRFYQEEKEVAAMIGTRNCALPVEHPDQLHLQLARHFTDKGQKLAALLASTRQFAIVTGGPGTGKTSTVVRILSILLDMQPDLKVRLAAPTGKAAMRLAESIGESTREIGSEHLLLQDPEVVTLHRLLGMRRDGRSFRRGPDNPVAADLLIVDEASMIDLSMMHRLLKALRADTRLLLLGDPGQLPSVDTGNVLADLCTREPVFTTDFANAVSDLVDLANPTDTDYKLANAVCRLETSYRFDEGSGIGILAAAVRLGTAAFSSSDDGTVTTHSPIEETTSGETLLSIWDEYVSLLLENCRQASILQEAFDRARVLCSHRRGFPGVEAVNAAIEKNLERRGLKQPEQIFYPGRPVLVTANDYRLDLFNGDIGICIPGEKGEEQVVFQGSGDAGQRIYLASRLPAHETCFAMTVHKAQGSEFDHVSLLLTDSGPGEDLLTSRELIYTAVTRAKKSISLYSTSKAWHQALKTSAVRVSGMTSFLGGRSLAVPTDQLDLF